MPALFPASAANQPPRLAAPAMPAPWPPAPALPQTMLLVEDSRLAAEGVRLICRRLGVRLRRADCLELAQAHLRVYRPDVVLVDPGLPDGSGLSLIAALSGARWRPGRIVGFSGDPAMAEPCLDAGADDFIAKPLQPARHLQALFGEQAASAALSAQGAPGPAPVGMPGATGQGGRASARPVAPTGHESGDAPACASGMTARTAPLPVPPIDRNHGADPLALQDDLRHARALLSDPHMPDRIGFAVRFLDGIARCAGDTGLTHAARQALASGDPAPLISALERRIRNNLDFI